MSCRRPVVSACRAALLPLAILALSSCDRPAAQKEFISEGAKPPPANVPLPTSWTTKENRRVFQAVNGFGFDLLHEASSREAGANVFLSPLSVSCALSLVMNGAVDSTRAAMESALNVRGFDLDAINSTFSGVRSWVGAGSDSRAEIGWANAVWVEEEFPLDAKFEKTATETYGGLATRLRLQDPKSLDRINGWVSKETRGRIPTILDDVDPLTVLIVTNAVYFKGRWTDEFETRATSEGPFTNRDGSVVQIPMMRDTRSLKYGVGDGFACVALPYRGGFEMVVALPDSGRTADDLVTRFAGQETAELPDLHERRVEVEIPKFRMEWRKNLKADLVSLGMAVAFDPKAADFSAMSPRGSDLRISGVIHRAFVEVDEKGTEAAAATAVEMMTLGYSTDQPDFVVFHVDRPFLFLIRESTTGAIFFLGKVEKLPA